MTIHRGERNKTNRYGGWALRAPIHKATDKISLLQFTPPCDVHTSLYLSHVYSGR